MQQALIVLAVAILSFALRACRGRVLRKLGALLAVATTFLLFYFVTGFLCLALGGLLLWTLFPLIDIRTHWRRVRVPSLNRVAQADPPTAAHYPGAAHIVRELDQAHFDHLDDSAWLWFGSEKFYRHYWHAEHHLIAHHCFCQTEKAAFAYLIISCHTRCGKAIHTTNYPLSPPLRHPTETYWEHLPCEKNSLPAVLEDHWKHLARLGLTRSDLLLPDPENQPSNLALQMQTQMRFNLRMGILEETSKGFLRYSRKGLFFLWLQGVRDMIRLC